MKYRPINILGIPWDDHSSYMQGPALAPPKIRAAFACPSSNQWTESGIDLGQKGIIQDAGDLVEYNPGQDLTGLTAMTAAKIMKELMGKIVTGHTGSK